MTWRFRAILLLTAAAIVTTASSAAGQVHVHGYTRSNGTQVAPHYRSNPDGKFSNNWSTKGNVNPYTGQLGTRVTPPHASGPPSASIDDSTGLGGRNTDSMKTSAASETSQVRLEELRERGVDMILSAGNQNVAVIGQRILRVGDNIGGFTVSAVDTTGVHIERNGSSSVLAIRP